MRDRQYHPFQGEFTVIARLRLVGFRPRLLSPTPQLARLEHSAIILPVGFGKF
jgi:hypothetical protein